MGYKQALDMQRYLGFDAALRWHLSSNHYPPVPSAMFDVCVAAITAANNGDWDFAVDLTDVAQYKGGNSAPARAIIEAHHLEAFIDTWEI